MRKPITYTATNLPTITHLQAAIMACLDVKDWTPGDELRETTKLAGGPKFYQAMERLEKDKLVKGGYLQKWFGQRTWKVRQYKLTAKGQQQLAATALFYDRLPMNYLRHLP